MIVQMRFRRGTTAEWAAANPVLEEGEPGLDTDIKAFKLGDGVTSWTDLPFQGGLGLPADNVPDTVGILDIADLEDEVNKVKAVLREKGLMA